ncbi:FimV family protein [Methylicorpusculum sp.]|uniref:type IV pilus assembly protein FimV n=1 Tax=Methylicorpusculum sp. TaxID=2713644 RepID=UPI002730D1CA|nr:hypothetical protein [Methylicorpusculum sp.]MDP2177815.1 hypothetical protein [Methylicorpusculum sp.]MDP3530013.1 hypothetical protein [Methylicorpusculum sp.]MDZ4151092.1 hypothetical protein [Methylicorpusculum sp.]
MSTTIPLITSNHDERLLPANDYFLSLQMNNNFYLQEFLSDKDLLDLLVFQVAKHPERLLTHVQRIYYCFQNQLSEPLYAALVDLLVVLNGRGKALGLRMVMGAKSRINPNSLDLLIESINRPGEQHHLIPGNHYSILSKGLMGVNHLVDPAHRSPHADHDPLLLARDCIEYSQLDEAQKLLETAIVEYPGRLELHQELTALYRSTRNLDRFNEMNSKLIASDITLPECWQQLEVYFKELNAHG